jgi:hypothetical protein
MVQLLSMLHQLEIPGVLNGQELQLPLLLLKDRLGLSGLLQV